MKIYKSDEKLSVGFGISKTLGGFWISLGPYTVIW